MWLEVAAQKKISQDERQYNVCGTGSHGTIRRPGAPTTQTKPFLLKPFESLKLARAGTSPSHRWLEQLS